MPQATVLLAPDDFDSLSAAEVAAAVGRGLEAGGWAVERCLPAEV
ncbi:MAG: hypothetical protein JWN32_1373, partial [Solirubrobacterales bacterium]|nr:hypothetical protein [Solirubrobacterales bacterium]